MQFCCQNAKKHQALAFECKECNSNICGRHIAIWTNDEFRCPICFSIAKQVRGIIRPEIITGNLLPNQDEIPICIVIDGTYIAGAQRHVLYLLKALSKANFSCHVVNLYGGGRWFEKFQDNCASLLVAYDTSASSLQIIKDFINHIDPVLINTHLLEPLHTIYSMGYRNYIATIHSYLTPHEMPEPNLTRRALNSAKAIIVPSKVLRSQLKATAGEKCPQIFVVSNCVDIEEFSLPDGTSKKIFHDNKCPILLVSRLDKDKLNLEMLINTLLHLTKSGIEWTLEIAGDGEIRGELMHQAKQRKFVDRIKFNSFVDDISKIYSSGDIVFFPSIYEGLALAAIEAMAMGKVVIATDVGDMHILGKDNASIIVPPNDSLTAAEKIVEIVNNRRLVFEIGRRAKKLAASFGYHDWSIKMQKIYKDQIH